MSNLDTKSYVNRLFGLTGQTAVVIGGNGVLGGAICQALGQAGAHIVVVGRSEETAAARVDELKTQDISAEYVLADVSDRSKIEALLTHCSDKNLNPQILVNGAGMNSATPFLEISDEEWDRILSVNLSSIRIACQVFGKYWLDQKQSASIINIASLSGITPLSRVFTYSASKAAVINLTQNLAREWAEAGIRVNALSPGFFPAEQNRKVLTEDRVKSIMTHTPANRFGEPEELAGAILLLAAQNAGSFITGHNLVVDGGFSCMTI